MLQFSSSKIISSSKLREFPLEIRKETVSWTANPISRKRKRNLVISKENWTHWQWEFIAISVIHMTPQRCYRWFRRTMNTLTKVVVAVFWSNVVKCEVEKMFLMIKVRLRILDPILKFIKRFKRGEIKSDWLECI